MKNISLTIDEARVAVAVIDMPGRPFNVFSEDMMDDLETLIETAEREQYAGLVITSGKGAFVAGADLRMIREFTSMRYVSTDTVMRDRFTRLGRLFRRLEQISVPTVAAVNGLALGGGLELAMSCHARVVVDVEAPILGLPEIVLGLLPGAGGTQRLPRLVNMDLAASMLLKGHPISPQQALDAGLVQAVVAEVSLIDSAKALLADVQPLAPWDRAGYQLPTGSAERLQGADAKARLLDSQGWPAHLAALYPAAGAIAACVVDGVSCDSIDAGFDVEWDIFLGLMKDPIAANMVRTCFLTKTAAPKAAQAFFAGQDAALQTVCWQSAQPAPKALVKKFTVVDSAAEAELLVADAPVAGLEDKTLVLRALSDSAAPSATVTEARYVGSLTGSEVVELNPASAIAAKANALLGALRLTPVVVAAGTSYCQCLLAAANQPAAAGIAKAVDFERLPALLGEAGSAPDLAAAKQQGLSLLIDMAFAAQTAIEQQQIASAELADFLAVYLLGYPKWSGGPASLLDMLRRKELDAVDYQQDRIAALAATAPYFGLAQ